MYTQRSAHVFTETRSIHFAQPGVAVAFRPQAAGTSIDVQQQQGTLILNNIILVRQSMMLKT